MSDQRPSNTGPEVSSLQQPETCKTRSCPIPGCGGRSWVLWALLIALALVYFNSNRVSSVPSAVPWGEDVHVAVTTAHETHQPVLLNFHAAWCGTCQMMAREVFSRKDVAIALSKWITVSIDGDKQPSAVSNYKIEAYPTFIALDSDGKEIFRYEGTMSADEFIRRIQAVGKALSASTHPTT